MKNDRTTSLKDQVTLSDKKNYWNFAISLTLYKDLTIDATILMQSWMI